MIVVDGNNLKIEDIVNVARHGMKIEVDEDALKKVEKARRIIEDVIEKGTPVYGVNTGFGELANVRINDAEIKELQKNLIRSHSCGTGDALPEETVRAMMLLRLNSLLKGYSGVRKELIYFMRDAINKKFYPFVPSQGSVGASGDLAPLAHIALSFMGEGEAFLNGERVQARQALSSIGMEPFEFEAKEGIAFINGTQYMTSIAALAIHDAINLIKHAHVAGAMSLQALKGTDKAFSENMAKARPHEGIIKSASILRKLVEGSEIIDKYGMERVQDAYTLRCMPQVFGAMIDSMQFIKNVVEKEINSATDNPLIFENEIVSCGNFHGEPIAIALDLLNIVLAKLSSFSERRIARMVDSKLSGLPPFLSIKPGLNSGMMIPQYVAASLVSENKNLSYPASVDSIPTSANQEDYQSMGSIAARKVPIILKNAEHVIAIEFIVASQALEFIEEKPSMPVEIAYNVVRAHVEALNKDRPLYNEIEKMADVIRSRELIKEVEKIVDIQL
ncbi:MAG: histidine ammonia-lyase [Thermoplasmata archaeon]|nr:histidine ammonia-lyase [Thermoplasmata archaeon]